MAQKYDTGCGLRIRGCLGTPPRRESAIMPDSPISPIPLVILAGSDLRASELPAAAGGKAALEAYKGIAVRIQGRPLISHLIERVQAVGAFDPVVIAGPAAVYRNRQTQVPVIDTDRNFAQNVRLALQTIRGQHPGSPIAFVSCDVLPTASDLRRALESYSESQSSSIWYPYVRIAKDRSGLGAFGWKPGYRIREEGSAEPVTALPGHLAIVRPENLRLRFIYRMSQVVYRTRNRSVSYRRRWMILRLLPELLREDLYQVLSLLPPTFTYRVLRNGLRVARRLGEDRLTVQDIEDALTRMAVKSRALRNAPERRVRTPILDTTSLALDVDTQEEAQELEAWVEDAPTSTDEGSDC